VVLGHALAILRRPVGRLVLRRADRALLAAASRLLPRRDWTSCFVTPETLVRWHRQPGGAPLELPEPATAPTSRRPRARAAPGAREPALGQSPSTRRRRVALQVGGRFARIERRKDAWWRASFLTTPIPSARLTRVEYLPPYVPRLRLRPARGHRSRA
jgi:hypothetical protein